VRLRAAIVTGVSRGLGEALAHALLERGYHVVGVGRTSAFRLAGPFYRFAQAELAQADRIDAMLEAPFTELAARRPEYVCLINNAAVGTPVGIHGRMASDAIAESLAINLAAPAALCNLFCRVFADDAVERRIINVSSGAASNAMPAMSGYCVAKAGLEMLTRVLATEKQGERFRAITIRPGVIDTGMQEQMRRALRRLPQGRAARSAGHHGGRDRREARRRSGRARSHLHLSGTRRLKLRQCA